MMITTNLRKMRTSLDEHRVAQYLLPVYDNLQNTGTCYLNPAVGSVLTIEFLQEIHCVETGKKIKKTFGEGMSYEAWMTSPAASPSIIRPELSRIHEGVALRDKEWEEAHHLQPHVVYLSRTSDIKVGVTRTINLPSRWIDQGATDAIVLAETPYRQLAGLIEVQLKEHLTDKTAWQSMLKNEVKDTTSLLTKKDQMLDYLHEEHHPFISSDDQTHAIHYPVLKYPLKVKSLKLESTPAYTGKLEGIKGQYLMFEDGTVFNVRAHAGYRVRINVL